MTSEPGVRSEDLDGVALALPERPRRSGRAIVQFGGGIEYTPPGRLGERSVVPVQNAADRPPRDDARELGDVCARSRRMAR